jgi:hypothetical protein
MEYEIHEPDQKNKACRKFLAAAAIVLTLGLVAALLVAGATATTRQQGNFLDASNLDYVEDFGFIYYDQTDSRVYVFTGICEDNSGVVASTSLDCGAYDTVCPTDEGYSFCVCGAAWKVAVVNNQEVLTIKTPYCTMSQTYMEEYQGVVIYADLVVLDSGYVVAPIAVDLSTINVDSDTFAQDVADIIISSDDYQSIVSGN